MKSNQVLILGIVLILLNGCKKYDEFDFEVLGFPFASPGQIVRLAAYGIPDWSDDDPHNGIDLIVDQNSDPVKIIAPSAGTIRSINISENPYSHPEGQLLMTVEIYINKEWSINLVFEPSTISEDLKQMQRNAIQVSEGDVVEPGEAIGDLLVGDLGYPHLHYMVLKDRDDVCAYEYSDDEARHIFELIALTNDGIVCY